MKSTTRCCWWYKSVHYSSSTSCWPVLCVENIFKNLHRFYNSILTCLRVGKCIVAWCIRLRVTSYSFLSDTPIRSTSYLLTLLSLSAVISCVKVFCTCIDLDSLSQIWSSASFLGRLFVLSSVSWNLLQEMFDNFARMRFGKREQNLLAFVISLFRAFFGLPFPKEDGAVGVPTPSARSLEFGTRCKSWNISGSLMKYSIGPLNWLSRCSMQIICLTEAGLGCPAAVQYWLQGLQAFRLVQFNLVSLLLCISACCPKNILHMQESTYRSLISMGSFDVIFLSREIWSSNVLHCAAHFLKYPRSTISGRAS